MEPNPISNRSRGIAVETVLTTHCRRRNKDVRRKMRCFAGRAMLKYAIQQFPHDNGVNFVSSTDDGQECDGQTGAKDWCEDGRCCSTSHPFQSDSVEKKRRIHLPYR